MTFRAIDLADFQPVSLAEQPAPTLRWVPVAELVIDDRYQRALTAKGRVLVQRIAAGFDWARFGALMVAGTVDGSFAVVDGQHRAHAAALCGLERVPCVVVPMTPVQQASAFGAINTDRLALDRGALFRARLAAGDPVAVAADRAVSAAGCRLLTFQRSSTQRRPAEISVHALILRMVTAGEAEAVTIGLRAIRDSAAGQEPVPAHGIRVWEQPVLMPWLTALATNAQFLRLPDLSGIFDEIDWDHEIDVQRQWARARGLPYRRLIADRIVAILAAARRQQVAA